MRPRLGSAPSRSSKRGSVIAPSLRSLAFPRPRLVSGPARMPWAVPTPFSMPALASSHLFVHDVKLAVVKDRLENGLTVREAMIKHKIPSESSVKAWCRQYRDERRRPR